MDMPASFAQSIHAGVSKTVGWTMEQKRLTVYSVCAVLDVVAVIAGFQAAQLVRSSRWLAIDGIPLVAGAIPIFAFFALTMEAYSVNCLDRLSDSFRRVLAALGATAVVIVTFAFFAQIGSALSRVAVAYAILSAGLFLIVARIVVSLLVRWALNGITVRKLLITDGTSLGAEPGCEHIDVSEFRLCPNLLDPVQLARISQIVAPYDKVLLSSIDERRDEWITALKATGIMFELIVPPSAIHNAVAIERHGMLDTLVISRGPLSLSSRIKKRTFDLALTIPLLVFLAPLLIIVALAIRFETPGPALFTQDRIGRGNHPFRIYKFRSMRSDQCDIDGSRSTSRGDDRITRVGRFIRSTSIDELPQLFNVLLGSMSLVGPRPHAFHSTAGEQLFWEVSANYWMRHALKPGITGLAQIRGFRGSTEKPEDLQHRLRCDLEYLQHWSLWQDLTILLSTLRVVAHDNAF